MLPIKKILCPTDFSDASYRGVDVAIELAEHFSAELIFINVVTPVYPGGAPGVPAHYKEADFYEEMDRFARNSLDDITSNKVSADVKTRHFVAKGEAVDAIIAQAEKEAVDLIIMATHGWTGWRRLFLGSVTDKVLRSAGCPVLTVSDTENQ